MYDRSDARWAVVKDLLHPDKRNFLPFDLSIYTPGNLLPDYVTRPSKFSLLLKKFAGVLIVMYWYRFLYASCAEANCSIFQVVAPFQRLVKFKCWSKCCCSLPF